MKDVAFAVESDCIVCMSAPEELDFVVWRACQCSRSIKRTAGRQDNALPSRFCIRFAAPGRIFEELSYDHHEFRRLEDRVDLLFSGLDGRGIGQSTTHHGTALFILAKGVVHTPPPRRFSIAASRWS